MKKSEYKQQIISCRECGGTKTRVFRFEQVHPKYGATWYVECECKNIDEWPFKGFDVKTTKQEPQLSSKPPPLAPRWGVTP